MQKMVFFPFVAVFSVLCVASSGDRQYAYQKCVSECSVKGCDLSLVLRWTLWDCESNCRYECTHSVTARNLREDGEVHQFHGKWPFTRLFGMQEPASVLFSLLNAWAHWRGFLAVVAEIREKAGPKADSRGLGGLYLTNACLCMFGWFWSAVFHARDLPFTEKMDYFSAVGSLLFNAYIALVKLFNLLEPNRRRLRTLLQFICIVFYTMHISYLSLWDFDYSYNMAAGITVGLSSNTAWLLWSLCNYKKRYYHYKILAFVILITLAMSLEVLDFPPWFWILDAHALWHAATVPLDFLLYSFILDDLRFDDIGPLLAR
ncbi:Per1-like protein [Chytriomyces sp. MP71]|nr:Per1-like protein [Chytriomyces sp. MP71]